MCVSYSFCACWVNVLCVFLCTCMFAVFQTRAMQMQVWDNEQQAFVSVYQEGMAWKKLGRYDAMSSGNALAVRELIEEHRDKMFTIRRRDFEVVDPSLLLQSSHYFLLR